MLNYHLAQQSAQNYRTLRKKGITVRKTIDCIIATFCIEENHSLLHRDSDFNGFEKHLGLNVIHPS
jgi:predicted nucleic acid-binding protein